MTRPIMPHKKEQFADDGGAARWGLRRVRNKRLVLAWPYAASGWGRRSGVAAALKGVLVTIGSSLSSLVMTWKSWQRPSISNMNSERHPYRADMHGSAACWIASGIEVR